MRVYRAVNGALIISQATRGADFPIVLRGDPRTGWLSKTTIDALKALSAVSGAKYTLTFNSTEFEVYFDNSSGAAIKMDYLIPFSAPDGDTLFYGEIKLICTGV